MTKQEVLLAKIALKKKYITQQQLDECLRIQKSLERPKPLVILMIEQGFISDKELESIIQYQQKYQQKIQLKQTKNPQKKSAKSKKSEKIHGFITCGFCKKKISENLPFCPHCKTQFIDVSQEQESPENVYYCGFCNASIKDSDDKCPRCGAVFTTEESLNEQVYSCANCKNLVSLSDRKCPNCGAQFDD